MVILFLLSPISSFAATKKTEISLGGDWFYRVSEHTLAYRGTETSVVVPKREDYIETIGNGYDWLTMIEEVSDSVQTLEITDLSTIFYDVRYGYYDASFKGKNLEEIRVSQELTVDPNAPVFDEEGNTIYGYFLDNGVLYKRGPRSSVAPNCMESPEEQAKETNELLFYPPGKKDKTYTVLPQTIQVIIRNPFVEELTFPNSLERIYLTEKKLNKIQFGGNETSLYLIANGMKTLELPKNFRDAHIQGNSLTKLTLSSGLGYLVIESKSLKTLKLPAELKTFYPTLPNAKISLAKKHKYFKMKKGIIYRKSNNNIVYLPNKGTAKKVKVSVNINPLKMWDWCFRDTKNKKIYFTEREKVGVKDKKGIGKKSFEAYIRRAEFHKTTKVYLNGKLYKKGNKLV